MSSVYEYSRSLIKCALDTFCAIWNRSFAENRNILFSSCWALSHSLRRCEVKIFSRAFRSWRQRCPCFAFHIEVIWGSVWKSVLLVVRLGWIEGRLDGDFADTNNFLTQRYCNSGKETRRSPFYPMNQHDPISAYKPPQLSLLFSPNNSDGFVTSKSSCPSIFFYTGAQGVCCLCYFTPLHSCQKSRNRSCSVQIGCQSCFLNHFCDRWPIPLR